MDLSKKIEASLILGAISDCIGGLYEGMEATDSIRFNNDWQISDDTQLTLATTESIVEKKMIDPESIAKNLLK